VGWCFVDRWILARWTGKWTCFWMGSPCQQVQVDGGKRFHSRGQVELKTTPLRHALEASRRSKYASQPENHAFQTPRHASFSLLKGPRCCQARINATIMLPALGKVPPAIVEPGLWQTSPPRAAAPTKACVAVLHGIPIFLCSLPYRRSSPRRTRVTQAPVPSQPRAGLLGSACVKSARRETSQ